MSGIPICIDISHHQGYCDMEEVAASGVLGIIHKATEGTSFVDDMRAENCANARKAGIAFATYHWLSPGSDPVEQMEFYLQTIEPVFGERLVIDYEQDGCTLDQLKSAVKALLDYNSDFQITVYSGHLLKEQLGENCDDFLRENTDLWLAQYTSGDPSWPDGTYDKYALWQYSETGEIPGIDDAYVDLNDFNGDEEAFLSWISPKDMEPNPPLPPPERELVSVDIRTPDSVMVEVTVNGIIRRQHRRRSIVRRPDLFRRAT
jgi:lysozyme